MTEIRFYHLLTQPLDKALAQILTKALAGGHRMVVRTSSDRIEPLAESLWTVQPHGFLPHGTKKDGHAVDQPIWITDKEENPNGADVLILTAGESSDNLGDYKLCCEVFDGFDENAVQRARERWKSYSQENFTVTYWKQNESGGWDQK